MKYKLLATCVASTLLVACNENKTADTSEKVDEPNTAQVEGETSEVEHSKVSGDLTEVTKTFNGSEYVSTDLSAKPEYFILYYTASW